VSRAALVPPNRPEHGAACIWKQVGDGNAAGNIAKALEQSHGFIGAWEAEFRRTAMALAGGSGWVIVAWNQHTNSLDNYWAWDHINGPVTGTPRIALDMYEHAFQMDFGAGRPAMSCLLAQP
jgi:Fe-Mn family superoxide dismutase